MSAMDGSIVNVSLVTIAKALNTDMEGVRWIVIVYLLVISALIGIGGSLGDIHGRKMIFQLGMLLFMLGSFFCAFSPTLEFLILSRILQALGAAALTANGLALVITYVEPSIRGRAIGLNSLVVAAALSTGPVVGGILTEFIGWPSIFILNLPIGLIGIILVQQYIPETTKKDISKLDYRGMTLFIVIAFSFVQGILVLFEGSFWGLIFIFIAFVCSLLFVFFENSHPTPMISIGIMKNRGILIGIISSFLCYMVYYSVVFLLPFYYQDVLSFEPSQTGILMIVPPLAMAIMGPFAGFFAEKVDAKKSTTIGAISLSLFVISLAILFIIFPRNTLDILFFIIPLVAIAAGSLTVFTVSNGTSVMNNAPEGDVSVVSGLIGLSRNIGFALATTISSAIFTFLFTLNNPENLTSGSGFISSYYFTLGEVYFIFAILALLGAVISYNR